MELTSKQRAQLRGLANTIDTIIHIGKDGIGENLVKQTDDALEARELIKGRVLENNIEYDARLAAQELAKATRSAGDRHQVRAVPGEPQQAQREAYPAGEAVKKAAGVSGIALKQEMEFS